MIGQMCDWCDKFVPFLSARVPPDWGQVTISDPAPANMALDSSLPLTTDTVCGECLGKASAALMELRTGKSGVASRRPRRERDQ